MKKSRFTEQQIVGVLKQAEAGVAVICAIFFSCCAMPPKTSR